MLDNNAIQLIKKLKSQPRQGTDPFAAVTAALGKVFSAYKDQGGEVIRQNVFGILAGQVQTLNNNLNVLEQLNLTVQSGFNKSTKNAAEFGVQLDAVAKNAGVNATKFKQYAGELRTVFAGQTEFYKKNGVENNSTFLKPYSLMNIKNTTIWAILELYEMYDINKFPNNKTKAFNLPNLQPDTSNIM